MSAREDILSAIRARRLRSHPRPPLFKPRRPEDDLLQQFSTRAKGANGEVRLLENDSDIAAAIAETLRDRNMPARIHVPPDSPLATLDWSATPGLARLNAAPGPDDAAVTVAPFAIAETGTLAYPSKKGEPASWHFRPGLEIAVLKARDIVPDLESVIARVKREGLPSTLNLVTGPSRTGDIEQTLELGAHGPKALVVLVVKE